LRGKLDGVPEKNLELLQRFMRQCQELIDVAMAASQEAEMAASMPAEAPALPQAQPVSELVPNTPPIV
jgi:hypothetical protein